MSCSYKQTVITNLNLDFYQEIDDLWKAVCAAVHLFKLSIICSCRSVGEDFCSGSVCCNQRRETGTSKTAWEAVCRRHVPHRSSYGRVSTQSDTSCLRRQTSSCRPCLCHTIQAADGGTFSVNHRGQGGRFPTMFLPQTEASHFSLYLLGKRMKLTSRLLKICDTRFSSSSIKMKAKMSAEKLNWNLMTGVGF